MISDLRRRLRGATAAIAGTLILLSSAQAYDSAVASIAPVVNTATAQGTVRSAEEIDTAAIKHAEELAALAAAEAAAKEAARIAALTYNPVYGGAVSYSSSKSATEAVAVNGRSLGQYKLTFYCPCSICCGKYSNGITSSGTRATEGRTIAVDPKVIPIGSKVFIEGLGDFIAEDVGGAIKGNKIDVFVSSHSRAYQLGVKQANVYVMS